jgi:hypothetical protein
MTPPKMRTHAKIDIKKGNCAPPDSLPLLFCSQLKIQKPMPKQIEDISKFNKIDLIMVNLMHLRQRVIGVELSAYVYVDLFTSSRLPVLL